MILGIDPGFGGAVAYYDPLTNKIEVFDMPVHKISGKRQIALFDLARIVCDRAGATKRGVVESVNAFPKQGVASSFKFGKSAGIAEMVVAANFISLHTVRPHIWKKEMHLQPDKDAARKRASELFPKQSRLFSRVKDDGRAEAVLLAYWGSLQP